MISSRNQRKTYAAIRARRARSASLLARCMRSRFARVMATLTASWWGRQSGIVKYRAWCHPPRWCSVRSFVDPQIAQRRTPGRGRGREREREAFMLRRLKESDTEHKEVTLSARDSLEFFPLLSIQRLRSFFPCQGARASRLPPRNLLTADLYLATALASFDPRAVISIGACAPGICR